MTWGSSFDPVTFVTDNIQSDIDKNRNISASKELMDYQNKLQNQNWEKQTEYYSPKNVMDRFKSAGLNPHLIYGAGTQSMSAAGNIGNVSTPSSSYKTDSVKNMIASQITAAQVKNLHEQNLNIKEQNKVLSAEAALKEQQAEAARLANLRSYKELPFWAENADSERRSKRAAAEISEAESYLRSIDKEFKYDEKTWQVNALKQKWHNLTQEEQNMISENALKNAQKIYYEAAATNQKAQASVAPSQIALNGALLRQAISNAIFTDTKNFVESFEKTLVENGIDPKLKPEYRYALFFTLSQLIDVPGEEHIEYYHNGKYYKKRQTVGGKIKYVEVNE